MEQEVSEVHLLKSHRLQADLHMTAAAAQERESHPRRPEQLPGSKRQLKDSLQKWVRLERISQVRWRKF